MIRLIVADDHAVVREGLRRIVGTTTDIELIGEARDSEEAIRLANEREADVLLLDVSMPGPDFLETLRLLGQDHPDIAVLVLTMHVEDHYAVRALRAGAAGFLTKSHPPADILEAVRQVNAGRCYVTASVAGRLLESRRSAAAHESLSEREYQVLCLLGAGRTVTSVAEQLSLSPKTVSTYRTRLLKKLSLAGTAELVRYAIEHGLVD